MTFQSTTKRLPPRLFESLVRIVVWSSLVPRERVGFRLLESWILWNKLRYRRSLMTLGSPPVASLSEGERLECVRTARKALEDAGLSDAPLMVGTGCKLVSRT
jgi:hypothetical protein